MSDTKPLNTPLNVAHVSLGARMVTFAGWNMPVQYPTGIIREHLHTRTAVSLFDTCHMGEFRISGPRAEGSLNHLLARAVSDQPVGSCRYNFLMTEAGGIRDDLVVYRMGHEEFYLVVNAGTRAGDAEWLTRMMDPSVRFRDESPRTGKLDLQGPLSAEILSRLGLSRADLPAYYHWNRVAFAGETVLLSRTGYTGELGFEVYVPWEKTARLWAKLLREPEVLPAGLGARDTLRLEMGLPLYGRELNVDTTPIEAGFGSLIKGGRTFVGDVFLSRPPRKKLVGLRLEGRRAARRGAAVMSISKRPIGEVTSGSFAPSLDRAVALAYINNDEERREGARVLVGNPEKPLKAEIAGVPFHRKGTARRNL